MGRPHVPDAGEIVWLEFDPPLRSFDALDNKSQPAIKAADIQDGPQCIAYFYGIIR